MSAGRYWIDHDGSRVEVEVVVGVDDRVARLLVDGEVVLEQAAGWPLTELRRRPFGALVISAWPGRVMRCTLVIPTWKEPVENPPKRKPDKVERHPMHPPPGTRAARFDAFVERHEVLYASRHVVLAVAQILFVLLGLSAIFGVVLPALFGWLPHISLPKVDLPDLPNLDFLNFNLFGWLPDIHITVPGWLKSLAETWHWWGPILIAIVAGYREVGKRRERKAKQQGEDAAAADDAPRRGAAAPPDERCEEALPPDGWG